MKCPKCHGTGYVASGRYLRLPGEEESIGLADLCPTCDGVGTVPDPPRVDAIEGIRFVETVPKLHEPEPRRLPEPPARPPCDNCGQIVQWCDYCWRCLTCGNAMMIAEDKAGA